MGGDRGQVLEPRIADWSAVEAAPTPHRALGPLGPDMPDLAALGLGDGPGIGRILGRKAPFAEDHQDGRVIRTAKTERARMVGLPHIAGPQQSATRPMAPPLAPLPYRQPLPGGKLPA